jgi:murein DD-endopeptidase MepM/ murein hydrolase activator NlpD
LQIADNKSLIFGHMNTADVTYGDEVAPGTYLGGMGGMSGIPHIHLEARLWSEDGSYQIVDPTLMLNGYYD